MLASSGRHVSIQDLYKENRKKLLLDALGNAFDQIGRSENNLFARIEWKNKKGEKTDAFIGISEEKKQLEIQVEIDGKPFFAYQTIQGKSRLFSSKFDSSISDLKSNLPP